MRRLLLTLLATAAVPASALAQNPSAPIRHPRDGFWFNLGLGYGSLGCQNCDGREGGFSGGFALGGTLSRNVQLGAFSNAWTKSELGTTLTVGSLVTGVRVYPSSSADFFLVGGLGLGTVYVQDDFFGSASETGLAALLGLGYDFRVGRNVSLTPFWNGVGITYDGGDANFGQIGLGLTIH